MELAGQRVLIAGCGDLGSALGLRLLQRGARVWGLRRRAANLPDGIRPLAADLTRREALAAVLPTTLDAVVYTAAAGAFDDSRYRAAYVAGPRTLLAVLEHQGQRLRRLLFTSSTAVYGQSGGEWVDESSPTRPTSFAGERVLEGERIFLTSPHRTTVLRLGGIYGPGRTRLLDRVRRGEATYDPDRPIFSNRIHRDDAAAALEHLLALESAAEVYLGVDDAPVPLTEVYRWLARRLAAPAPRQGRSLESRQRGNKRCRNRRLRQSGFELLYPTFREGYRALLPSS
ncbi:MAG: SDR family oxidoreductase [Acidobacteriota bacterium]